MPKIEETKFGSYFKLPNPSLRSYFGRVVQGQPDEYRTPFYKGKTVTQVLDGWMPQLEVLKEKWPTLYAFEEDLAKKVGPMSIMLPLKERMADIDSYYDSILLESSPLNPEAIDAVIQEWKAASGLRLRSDSVTNYYMKKSTSSGSPFFRKRRDVEDDTLHCDVWIEKDEVVQNIGRGKDWRSEPGEFWKACAILGWRGQEGGPKPTDVKQRVVWMFPYAVNICELEVYQPLIEVAQHFHLVPAWESMEAVDECITRLFDTKGTDDLIVCTDFSKFDQHFNEDMSNAAKQILKGILTKDVVSQWWLDKVFPIKFMIPLAYDWGKMRFGKHGMASGSGGTNADETLTHRALQYEAAQSANARLNPNSMCLGDDGILSYPGITIEDVTRIYSSHGQDMNLDKQYASTDDCTYLRRWHHKDYRKDGVCVGVYSTARALGRLAEQERYYDPDKWSKEMVALRQLSILENIKHHPLREEFVDYCMKGDKYRLGLDIPGFLDNIEGIAREATDHMPDFLGYTKSMQKHAETGISNWWIVKYLKSKA